MAENTGSGSKCDLATAVDYLPAVSPRRIADAMRKCASASRGCPVDSRLAPMTSRIWARPFRKAGLASSQANDAGPGRGLGIRSVIVGMMTLVMISSLSNGDDWPYGYVKAARKRMPASAGTAGFLPTELGPTACVSRVVALHASTAMAAGPLPSDILKRRCCVQFGEAD